MGAGLISQLSREVRALEGASGRGRVEEIRGTLLTHLLEGQVTNVGIGGMTVSTGIKEESATTVFIESPVQLILILFAPRGGAESDKLLLLWDFLPFFF